MFISLKRDAFLLWWWEVHSDVIITLWRHHYAMTSSLYVKTYVAIAIPNLTDKLGHKTVSLDLAPPSLATYFLLRKRYALALHKFDNCGQNFNFKNVWNLGTKLLVIDDGRTCHLVWNHWIQTFTRHWLGSFLHIFHGTRGNRINYWSSLFNKVIGVLLW